MVRDRRQTEDWYLQDSNDSKSSLAARKLMQILRAHALGLTYQGW